MSNKKSYQGFAKNWRKRSKLPHFTVSAIAPNVITITSLCTGLSAIRMAMLERWDFAIFAIVLAGFLDAMDGRIARLLGATSRFGELLDSFADVIAFGVAPALVLYMRSVHTLGNPGWIAVLFFSVCMALRLARFNASLIDSESRPEWADKFFTGVPAPIAALLGLTPVIMYLQFGCQWMINGKFVAINMILTGCLMISRIPTIAIKKMQIPPKFMVPTMLMLVLTLGMLYSEPWLTLSILAWGYIIILPITIYNFYKNFPRKKVD